MRLARVACAADHSDPKIDALVAAADLDVLQLDYDWQLTGAGSQAAYAAGFLRQLESLQKTLYLDPRLHLLTNAGGSAVTSCVESLTERLNANGAPELLVSAIRGSNLLPRLEELSAAGIEIVDRKTQQPLLEIQQPLLAAQVLMGAGPLVTALDEGARIVVAGCYDESAPALAAAAHTFDWPWDNYEALAKVATAANMAPLATNVSLGSQEPSLLPQMPWTIEVELNGSTIIRPMMPSSLNAESLGDSVQKLAGSSATFCCADVVADVSSLELGADPHGLLDLQGITGRAPEQHWLLRATFADSYGASALIKLPEPQVIARAEQILGSLNGLLQFSEQGQRDLSLECLRTDANTGVAYVRAACLSPRREPCEHFLREVSNFTIRNSLTVDAFEPVHQTHRHSYASIPRDAVDVSVDTRPANQWM